jgi:gliding motility-associated transport system permease protein
VIQVFKKEIIAFFSSLVGYVAISVFLLITGLFIWVFPGNMNVFDFGFADLNPFFDFAPLVFLFLIPAITMRTFAEEKNAGTLELLFTRPVTDIKIILGKYFAALVLVVFALLPTLIYVFTISALAVPKGEIDSGAIIGSYIGLLLIASAFVSIGLFVSSITDNQIVAFILGIFLCFFALYAFDFISQISEFSGKLDYYIRNIGMNEHYVSISRGVLDSRDLVYFLTVNIFFIVISKTALESRKW